MTQRPFAVFDIDGTLIRWQLYHAIADAIIKRYGGKKQHQKMSDARIAWKNRKQPESFKQYETVLVQTYDMVLTKITYEEFMRTATSIFDQYKQQVYRFTRELIDELKKADYQLFAISGSQNEIVSMIAEYYGFDDSIGTEYEWSDTGFTGKFTLHSKDKHLTLDNLVKKHNATYQGSIGVGDSEGDISMLSAVEQPIAMNPSQKLFEHARKYQWKVVVERKNMIYQLEWKDGAYVLA